MKNFLPHNLENAIRLTLENGDVSFSLLQRKLKLNYPQAKDLIDQMHFLKIIEFKNNKYILCIKNFDDVKHIFS